MQTGYIIYWPPHILAAAADFFRSPAHSNNARFQIMIRGLFFIFAFQLAGSVLAVFFSLPVPGPVIGMGLLLCWLGLGIPTPESLDALAETFLRFLPLLFVPAAVGVIRYKDELAAFGPSLLVIIVISTLAGLLATVICFTLVARFTAPPNADETRGLPHGGKRL